MSGLSAQVPNRAEASVQQHHRAVQTADRAERAKPRRPSAGNPSGNKADGDHSLGIRLYILTPVGRCELLPGNQLVGWEEGEEVCISIAVKGLT